MLQAVIHTQEIQHVLISTHAGDSEGAEMIILGILVVLLRMIIPDSLCQNLNIVSTVAELCKFCVMFGGSMLLRNQCSNTSR